MKKTVLASALALACASGSASAVDVRDVKSPSGETIFKLHFFDEGEGELVDQDTGEARPGSTRTLIDDHKNKIAQGVAQWAERLRPAAGASPGMIHIRTTDDLDNAGVIAPDLPVGPQKTRVPLQLRLAGQNPGDIPGGFDALFDIGQMDFDTVDFVPSQLPRTGRADTTAIAFHEMAHALGMETSIGNADANDEQDLDSEGDQDLDLNLGQDGDQEEERTFTPRFGDKLNAWDSHLRDDNGNAATPGQIVMCEGCDNAFDPDGFDVRKDQAHFVGSNVTEVLAGALPGLPVKILAQDLVTGGFGVNDNYMSHSELKNSMMSHQDYRNHTTFMEAELAAMQDMGYDIDRRNFFGFSVYGDDKNLVNTHGFFARNATGTAYLPGQYNRSTLGLGLHVYGSGNTITQRADLLTVGAGAAGVRVDGGRNTLTIPRGTRVHADGLNGRGVMFAYGKDHRLVLAGDVQAMGEQGVGASFDFGDNLTGNAGNYRGSHINTANGQRLALPEEIDGALVKSFDLTGRVAGKQHAIFMSRNAWVDRINVMTGAQIDGSIRSDYAERDDAGRLRLTRITFGEQADAQGRSTGGTDANFNWRHDGAITGGNIVLEPKAGTTSLNGTHTVHSVAVAPGATLTGNGSYTLAAGETFVNHGTLAPGDSMGRITINGGYRQSQSGTLKVDVNGAGQSDVLRVSGTAALAGKMIVVPQPDWYGPDWRLRSDAVVQADAVQGAFESVAVELDSPTLKATTASAGKGVVAIGIERPLDAYRQHGRDRNARQAGTAVHQLASRAADDADTRALIKALDFSAADGSTVTRALDQINASSYSVMHAGSLAREQQIGGLVTQRATQMSGQGHVRSTSEWTTFATPFGGGIWQDRRGSTVGFSGSTVGLLAGVEKRSATQPDWVVGGTGAVSGQSITTRAPYDSSGTTTALTLGLHARYAPDDRAGPYAFGQAQIGLESGKLDRRINVPGYSAKNTGKWTGWNGALTAGAGYRWTLSDAVTAGPVASLSYTRLSRPGFTESGSSATRLKLDASALDSVRSSIGVNLGISVPVTDSRAVRGEVQVSWDNELFDRRSLQDAAFARVAQARMSSGNRLSNGGALGIRAGLAYPLSKTVTLGANVSGQFAQAGRQAVNGDLSLNWRF